MPERYEIKFHVALHFMTQNCFESIVQHIVGRINADSVGDELVIDCTMPVKVASWNSTLNEGNAQLSD